MKQGFGKLKSLREAIEIMGSLVSETGDEEMPLKDALNRIAARDIVSSIDVPHFQKSAMDGFAVMAADTFGASQTKPKMFKIVDSVTAGVLSKKEFSIGECIEVTTGAPLPKNSDAVVMVEYAEKENNNISVYRPCTPGENTIGLGSDIKKGSVVIKKGTILNPARLGVLSAIGMTKVAVKRKPLLAYFSSGNEIQAPGSNLGPGTIYDINSTTMASAIKGHGCELLDLGLVRDNVSKIKDAILAGVTGADMVMLSGGSSLGGEDFMLAAVEELGEVLVHGIAVKPGKPVLVGNVKGKLVLGLPGYPTSALSNFYILAVPLIRKMLGVEEKKVFIEKKLARKIASTIGRYEFMAVKIDGDLAVPVMKGSSSITTLADADGFLEIDENTEVLNKGDIVKVRLFESCFY